MNQSFPKSCRLLHRKDFQKVFRKGDRKIGKFLSIEIALTQSSPRLGVVVTKKFGKAHDRNRFKRLVRESFRKMRRAIKVGIDCIVRPKATFPVDQISEQAILSDLESVLHEYL